VSEATAALGSMMTSMNEIKKSSSQISRIMRTVDEIAFQTNILALNAAVEAARAGEAGLGFAVVADEVRNLAQRSAEASRDTSGLIEQSVAKTQQGAASREQAQSVSQISESVQHMETITQESAAIAQQNAAASEEMSAQAETAQELAATLQDLIGTQSASKLARTADHGIGDDAVSGTSRPRAGNQSTVWQGRRVA
jgi:methyl-accepting chemotaxis protein